MLSGLCASAGLPFALRGLLGPGGRALGAAFRGFALGRPEGICGAKEFPLRPRIWSENLYNCLFSRFEKGLLKVLRWYR